MPACPRFAVLPAVMVAAASLLASCGNAPVTVTAAGNTDGVFPDRIVVGALASQTGFVTAEFAPAITGAQVYLDMVNHRGGVDGRRIDLAYKLDDQSAPSVDTSQARTLVDQNHVFAVVAVATPSFTGASYLASHNVPTFGLNVNPNSQWGAGPSMFGNTGSYTNFSAPQLQAAFLAEQRHVHGAAVLAYGVAQSQQGCLGVQRAFAKYDVPVAYQDTSVPPPAIDLHADVNRMRAASVDMVTSCMDFGANVLLARTMQQSGVTGAFGYWFDGYSTGNVQQFAPVMQGVYFLLSHAPFEVTQLYPGKYPGMDLFQTMLKRYAPGTLPSEAALAGWTSADLFVTGLRAIGPDVTRERLVHAINRMTAYTADDIEPPIDWRIAHKPVTGPTNCSAFVQVQGHHFVPVFGTPPSVFSCFPVRPPAAPPINVVTPLPAGVPPLPPRAGTK